MKHFLLSTAILLAAAPAVDAQQGQGKGKNRELSAPIVAYTPVIKKNADALGLTEAQRADLQNWISTMPAKRKAVEAEAIEARAALRAAINAGAPVEERQKLAETVGAYETKLVMMRSNCTDHWRAVLTDAQFAQMLELAGQ